MKVLISDYEESMMPTHDLEIQTLREGLGEDLEIEVWPYTDERREEFCKKLAESDALLSAFVPVDDDMLSRAPRLKVISINATGWDAVDLDACTAHNVGVCPVGEYCTWDVSEAAIAYMFALNKHIKQYANDIDERHVWDYAAAPAWPRLEDQVLGIVGFGKIGKCTARKASGLVREIVAWDPYVDQAFFDELGVRRAATFEEVLRSSDVIVNHTCLTEETRGMFNADAFAAMERCPIVINLGRGLSIDEPALIDALDSGRVRAFGADVLYDETPDLANHPLVGRDNVIITPHAAFYSTSSLRDLQVLSCKNIVNYLCGRKDDLFKLVNDVEVVDAR